MSAEHSSAALIARGRSFGMDIGYRLRSLREEKQLSQGDIEKRTGLLRCYISRVENGHTMPAIETLEKMARAMEIPLYQIMYDGQEPPKLPPGSPGNQADEWGSAGKDSRFLRKLRRSLAHMNPGDRQVLLLFAGNLVKQKRAVARG
jgi:transcriptional regulator with XRE-family HTH domain